MGMAAGIRCMDERAGNQPEADQEGTGQPDDDSDGCAGVSDIPIHQYTSNKGLAAIFFKWGFFDFERREGGVLCTQNNTGRRSV